MVLPQSQPQNLDDRSLIEHLRAHAQLGHAKRDQALLRQVQLILDHPGAPPAQATAGSWPQLLALYRFLDNDHLTLEQLRQLRRTVVLETIPQEEELLNVHDISLLDYTRHNAKTDRRVIGDGGGRGYEYVSNIALSGRDGRFLGVLHDCLVGAQGPDDRDAMPYDDPLFQDLPDPVRQGLPENHRHQLSAHVRGLAPELADRRVVHVTDREFDDTFDLLAIQEAGQDFVARLTGNRSVMTPKAKWIPKAAQCRPAAGHPLPEGWVCVALDKLARAVPLTPYKSVGLDEKGRVVTPGQKPARQAELFIGSCRVRLYRWAKRGGCYVKPPRPLEANLVVVRELAPPPGEKPLCWLLLTSLPTATPEQLRHVAQIYEWRWGTETYYRLLKSGYRIEESRLEEADKVGRLLVLVTLGAMVLMQLKVALNLGPTGYLSAQEYARLKRAREEPGNPALPLGERLYALAAKLGGWLGRRRDPIGPLVLMRGLRELLTVLSVVEHDRSLLEEVAQNRELIRKLFCV